MTTISCRWAPDPTVAIACTDHDGHAIDGPPPQFRHHDSALARRAIEVLAGERVRLTDTTGETSDWPIGGPGGGFVAPERYTEEHP